MFTGLIQGLGSIYSLENYRFSLTPKNNSYPIVSTDLAIGDSVAVDGVCLTVEEFLRDGFVATASPETLSRTTLGYTQKRSPYVNLESSLQVGSKIGGHFVTGHVDGIGCLVESVVTATSWEMTFAAPREEEENWYNSIAPYIVSKGSIAVNGVSLTVAQCEEHGSWFKVAVIPHTYLATNLQHLQLNQWVNLEGDILGKYVEKFIQKGRHSTSLPQITPDFLLENGFLN